MPDLLTIGAFARRCGLTASALRFYADSGLVRPIRVDEESGYRYYSPGQVSAALLVRRLREIGLPLERVGAVLAADPAEASRIIDDHVAGLASQVQQARETAAAVKATLGSPPPAPPVRLTGPVFTAAIEQVLTATTQDLPVLNGVHLEVSPEAIVLTATDRYRLSTRTLVPAEPSASTWTATADADDLRLAMPWTRRQHELHLSLRADEISFQGDGVRTCRTLADDFPDYRLMLASLPEVLTRAVISRNALVACLERQYTPQIRLDLSAAAVTVGTEAIPADVTGPPISLSFAVSTLHPAISTAVGPDVMLDVAGPHLPVVVRSADDGDLTTLAMPVKGAAI
ncbi:MULTISPECIES: DNA polymerase III subunit beta family protein [Amycolatopsis]|uniref:DNA polymerase III subunit beta family protein n=1 Tax=Amycolatopsis TaxID=1813 RepID=UPI001F0210D2|nr:MULTISPECIES: MerR family transcriptional regulator [Amycolatopsis]UKD51311.1 MerR family transcriptional regulator [Amycolatopsis sp. FU40]